MRLLAPLSLLLAAVALVACGGSSGGGSTGGKKLSSTSDPQKILADTFSASNKKVESGKFNMTLKLDVSGGGSTLNGPINVTLAGPFQSQGKGKVPKFKVDLSFQGAGQNIKAGATSTGDKGFLNYNGQDYAVPDNVFKQFASGYTQAQSQNKSKGGTLKELGIQPQTWLKDPKVDSGSSVGGTDTVKVSGGVDLPKMLDDINTLLGKAGSLGLPNAGTLPTSLTDAQKTQIEKAVKSASVEIESGKDDSILRRIAFTLDIADPTGSGGKATVDFDLSLTDLGADQSISAPSSTKPLNDLLGQLGGLGGALGSLGGASGSSSSGASSAAAGKYADCVKQAGTDVSKAQQCASILTP